MKVFNHENNEWEKGGALEATCCSTASKKNREKSRPQIFVISWDISEKSANFMGSFRGEGANFMQILVQKTRYVGRFHLGYIKDVMMVKGM